MKLSIIVLLVSWATLSPLCGSAAAGDTRSIREWTVCDGKADDAAGVAKAFNAARHGAFTLTVDCPVRLHIGMDIARTVFIDDGTTVRFVGSGKFIVDNVFHPAFSIANSSNIVLENWNVEYDASLPVDWRTGGFENAGVFVASAGNAPPAGAFNDRIMTAWLSANRSLTFDHRQGFVTSMWSGPTNACAIFYITGDSSNLTVKGLKVYAPPGAGADRFVPVVFSMTANYRSHQSIDARTAHTAQFVAVPHDLTFSDIYLDGIYMGWQGTIQDAHFEKIRSNRYSDLQDASGGNIGGVGKWFAPPHLLYLNYDVKGDPALFNKNLTLHDVVDAGPRVGLPRDKGAGDTISGFANSLKIGGDNCSVDQYSSSRPDGFVDVLSSNGLTISNVTATYDSSFINNLFPGFRFPLPPYKNVTLKDIVFKDLAPTTTRLPIDNMNQASNDGIVFSNIKVDINHWSGTGSPLPVIAGQRNDIVLHLRAPGDHLRAVSVQKGSVAAVLQATKRMSANGPVAVLTWSATQAAECSAGGAWSGTVASSGTKTVQLPSGAPADFSLDCKNSADSLTARVHFDQATVGR